MRTKLLIFCLFMSLGLSLSAQGAGNSIKHTYINCGSNSSLSLSGSFTIEAWIYPLTDDMSGEHSIIDRRYGDGGYQLRLGSGSVSFRLRATGGAEYAISASGLVANKWQHIAGVYRYESSSGNHYHEIYINGVLKAGPTNLGSFVRGTANTEFYIGGSKLVNIFLLNGEIDEVRAWSKALTAEEIRNNMCTKLSGSNANLEGYWRFDEASGTCEDLSNNTNNSTNIPARVVSGAPIGDASVNDYASPSTLSFYSGSGDGITADTYAGSPLAIQIYRVDSEPNVTTPPAGLNQLSQSHYFGVFVVGGTSPTYKLTYNYNGHPGISNENNLELASRSNNATTSWIDLDATLDTGANTLIKTDQTGTEYILSSTSDNTLPVELSSFFAQFIGSLPILCWTTQSETDNAGWNVYRGDYRDAFINGDAIQINPVLIEGAGTTTIPTDYTFEDQYNVIAGDEYWYILESVDYSGETQIHGSVSLIIPEENTTPELPQQTVLMGNYPNPFNPNTYISFMVKENETAHLSIFNLKGQKLESISFEAGIHNYFWDASSFASGIYLYKLKSESFSEIRKMILLK